MAPKSGKTRAQPVAPPVYRPQPIPKVLQRKAVPGQSAAKPPERKPTAPPVYRPQALPGAMQAKMVQRRKLPSALRPTPSAPAAFMVAQSKSGIQLKPIRSNVIQRMEIDSDEEKKVDLRYAVLLKVSLNGVEIGGYVSKTSKFAGASEHDHAEDGIIHAIQGVVTLLELSGGRLSPMMSKGEMAIAAALKFDTNNILRIYELTASPCTSCTAKKKTSNKGKGEGCTEQLIELAKTGLDFMVEDQIIPVKFDITVEAHHLYQPGEDGDSKAASKASSADAVKRMVAAGITVKITKK